MRAALRLLAGFASMPLGCVACVAVIAATGGPDLPSLVLAFALLLLGFVGVAVVRTPSAPWRPARVCLAWGGLVTSYLLAGLPFPPQGADMASALTLAALLLGALGAALGVTRWPRVAACLLGLRAAHGGTTMAVRFATVFGRTPGVPQGPAFVISYVLAGSIGAAWLGALWHGRALLRASAQAPALGTT